jgi:type IV pilus assembly protein PilM
MAKPATILTLNLGMQTVSMAEFEVLPGDGLRLTGFREAEMILDPAADATRPDQLKALIKELRDAISPKSKKPIYACLPSQSVFSRFVQLPGDSAEDVESIIPFEAQQNVPYPIDEVVWDHQLMGQKHGDTWDVGLVAIKADQLDDLVAAIKQGGLQVAAMDLAPMALYNALRYNLPDLPGCTLVIDLGARSTNLVFSEGDRVFCRSIPIAGHTISAAIAKEFEQDLVLAEKLKIEKGQVGLGGAYAEPADPTEARIAKVVRNTMTRLHSEISRSINFYRTNHNGTAPDRILLAGGNAKLTYATDFFAEKLNAPVDFFNPLQNIEVQPGALPEGTVACASGIGELVGLALRSLKNCPVELNLTPPSVVKAMDFRRRIPSFALAGLLLILTPALWFGYFTAKEKSIRARTSALVSEKNPLEQTAKEIREGLEKQKILAAAAEPFLTSVAERTIWPNLIEELAAKMPSRHIWITKLTPVEGVLAEPEPPKDPKQPTAPRAPKPNQPTGKPAIVALQVDGLYLDNPPNPKAAGIVDEFVTRLDESPFFNTSGDRTKIITQRTTPTGETWAYGYTLVLPLKTPVPLP